MDKTAYLHTFHSQVATTLLNVDYLPDIIISFDSHVDTQMGFKEHIDAFPPIIRNIALRASAHTFIRNSMGVAPIYAKLGIVDEDFENLPMYLIIPKRTLHVEVERFKQLTATTLEESGGRPMTKKRYKVFTKHMFAINIVESPPGNLGKFVEKQEPFEESVWDIDIDYFAEFQRECFSPFKAVNSSFLGNLPRVLKLIRKYQPDMLTISEMKNEAVEYSGSRFSRFLTEIQKLGYETDYENIIDQDDEELVAKLERYDRFVKEIQEPIQKKHAYSVNDESSAEILDAIKRFWK